MEKYLYLTERAWVAAWVSGGRVPLRCASAYLADERVGTTTPDETRIEQTNLPPEVYRNVHGRLVGLPDRFQHVAIIGCSVDGKPLPDFMGSSYREDGAVLCLSNAASRSLMTRLGKAACVRIRDVEELKASLDAQVGACSLAGSCRYTSEHFRDHFMKSDQDAWQEEFRMIWPGVGDCTVEIAAGTAEEVRFGQEFAFVGLRWA